MVYLASQTAVGALTYLTDSWQGPGFFRAFFGKDEARSKDPYYTYSRPDVVEYIDRLYPLVERFLP